MSQRGFIFLLTILLAACARQTTPTGGPQDKTPPALIRSTPANNEKNFKGKTITLTFDEAVKLKDPKDEIIIAPSPGKDITYTAKQSRVIIELKNDLADTTTYSMTFREGIQDLTEGNPTENLRIAFSTGAVIDSLSIQGSVLDALTEKIPEKITVAIFSSDTFNIFKHTPSYFTKANKAGRFVISNLKAGSYKVYAFEDKNKNLKLETKTERFGFIPGRITLRQSSDSLRIPLLALDSRPLDFSNIRHTRKASRIKFNKSLVGYSTRNAGTRLISAFGEDHSEVVIYHNDPITDSVALTFHGVDSIDQSIDTLFYIKSGGQAPPPDPFQPNVVETKFTIDPPGFAGTINFNKPLQRIVLDTFRLTLDSAKFIELSGENIIYDTLFRQLRIHKTLEKKMLDTLKRPVELYIGKGSFFSIDNDTSRTLKKSTAVPKVDEMAILYLDVQTQKNDYHVQLLTPDYKVVKESLNTPKIAFKNVPPGEFKIRVFIDSNKNGKWDPGNVVKDIPPEPTYYYRHTDGKYQITLRAFWEVGPYTVKF